MTLDTIYTPTDHEYIEQHYRQVDEKGRSFQAIALTGAGTRNGESGKPWKGIDPTDTTALGRAGSSCDRYGLTGESVQDELDSALTGQASS